MWRLQVDEVTKTGVNLDKSCPPSETLTLKVKKTFSSKCPWTLTFQNASHCGALLSSNIFSHQKCS